MGRINDKVKRIFTGWFLFLTFWDSWESKRRRIICYGCPKRTLFVCGECGCPIPMKTRVKEEDCPLKKW